MSKTQNFEWSSYQKAIFDNIAHGKGHTIIDALAGSSKTTTLIEALKYIDPKLKCLMVAFNKSIAEELKARAPKYIECSTMHSLGYRIIRNAWGNNIKVDNDKSFDIIKKFLEKETKDYQVYYAVDKTVGLCKAGLIDIPNKIDDLMDDFGIDTFDFDREKFINAVIQTLKLCKAKKNIIDFNDMIWFPLVFNLVKPVYQVVLIDELQDLSYAQTSLAILACRADGRIIGSGDKFQSIYSWSSGSSDTVDRLRTRLEARSLDLPISYRCPKSVIKIAQSIVPTIQYAPNAIDGLVKDISEEEMMKVAKPGDVILSRINSPLVKLCLSFIRNKVPAKILGKDVGLNLLTIIKKSKKKTLDKFLDWLDNWRNKEINRLSKKKKDSSDIEDKYQCLKAFCDGALTIDELKGNIEKLFSDDSKNGTLILSSIHKYKGKEANVVFVLKKTLKFFNQEEKNICYVSYTRSKDKLYLVSKS